MTEETNSSGGAVARYSRTENIDEPLAILRGGVTTFYDADGLGSITSMTSAAGALSQSYAFDSFGKLTGSTGSLTNPTQYTGRDFDSETGLNFYRARYYYPTTGRFITEDPIGFAGGSNFYTYVKNNVPNTFDPLGLAQCWYSISAHTLTCVPNEDHTKKATLGPNGVFSGLGPCQNKPSCSNDPDLGPIPPGEYKMNGDTRPGQQLFYRLEPVPPVHWWQYYSGLRRNGFELHPGSRSLGCITTDKDNSQAIQQYQQIYQLLQSESGNNWLLVSP